MSEKFPAVSSLTGVHSTNQSIPQLQTWCIHSVIAGVPLGPWAAVVTNDNRDEKAVSNQEARSSTMKVFGVCAPL